MKKLLPLFLLFVSPLAYAAPSLEGLINALIWLIHVLVGLVAFVILIYFVLSLLPPLGHGLR